jgi:hypothetical protein
VGTVEENRASALLRYFTCRIAVEMRMKRSKYEIGKVKMRYNDNDKRDETPFVDNTVKPPSPKNEINIISIWIVRGQREITENGH